jgi:hypothetical protein
MSSKPEVRKGVRDRQKSQGLCVVCGKPSDGRSNCQACRERSRLWLRAKVGKCRQAGICTACRKVPAASERTMCKPCLIKLAASAARARLRHETAGACNQCGAARAPGRKLCQRCIGVLKEQYRKYKQNKMCVYCGKKPAADGIIHCATCREYVRAKGKLSYRRLRDIVFAAYGGAKCACCGEAEIAFLQIDHVNGDGAEHRRVLKSSSKIYRWLKVNGFPPGFQVLCANCNHAKGRYGVCPHQQKAHAARLAKDRARKARIKAAKSAGES